MESNWHWLAGRTALQPFVTELVHYFFLWTETVTKNTIAFTSGLKPTQLESSTSREIITTHILSLALYPVVLQGHTHTILATGGAILSSIILEKNLLNNAHGKKHAKSTKKGPWSDEDSNRGPSCYEATVQFTISPCRPQRFPFFSLSAFFF